MTFQTILGLWRSEWVLQVAGWRTWWMKILFVDLDTRAAKAKKPLLHRRRVVYSSIQLTNIWSDLINTVKITCRWYTAFSSPNVSAWDQRVQNVHPVRQMRRWCSRNVRFGTQPCNTCCLTCRAIVSKIFFSEGRPFEFQYDYRLFCLTFLCFSSLFSDVYQINISKITAYSRSRWPCCQSMVLKPPDFWDSGFEFCGGHGYSYFVLLVCCVGSGSLGVLPGMCV
jgi:hypothetical protein